MPLFGNFFSLLGFLQLPRGQRKLVFYSEGKNYWIHLEAIIGELLEQTSIYVCYITSDRDDPGLVLSHDNFHAFSTDEGWIRDWLFQNIDTDVLVMTMPDLDQYQVKRSRFPVHYVYVQHSLVSLHMAYRPAAFNCFDTIFCAGPHHSDEVRALEQIYGLEKRVIVEHGYGRLDSIIASVAARENGNTSQASSPRHVLIAPSWGETCTIELIGEKLVDVLVSSGFQVTLRPHPQTVKFSRSKVDAIVRKFQKNPLFNFESNAANQESLHQSDIMISDWSGAAFDYAFGLTKPVLFIDVPMKINNPDYAEIDIVPFEVAMRTEIGSVVGIDELDELPRKINEILDRPQGELGERLQGIREASVFNTGSSHRAACLYIEELLHKCPAAP